MSVRKQQAVLATPKRSASQVDERKRSYGKQTTDTRSAQIWNRPGILSLQRYSQSFVEPVGLSGDCFS